MLLLVCYFMMKFVIMNSWGKKLKFLWPKVSRYFESDTNLIFMSADEIFVGLSYARDFRIAQSTNTDVSHDHLVLNFAIKRYILKTNLFRRWEYFWMQYCSRQQIMRIFDLNRSLGSEFDWSDTTIINSKTVSARLWRLLGTK